MVDLDTEVEQLLRTTSLFATISEASLFTIAAKLRPLHAVAGQRIIREGEPGDSIYLVRTGQLKVAAKRRDGGETFLDLLEPGDGFGEIALLTGERRTASVTTTVATDLLCLTRAQFDQLSQEHPEATQQITQAILHRAYRSQLNLALRTSRLFDELPEALLHAIAAELELVLLPGGSVLMQAGDTSDALYLVISGRLRAVRTDDGEVEHTLYELSCGETVGELSLLAGTARPATVYAQRDCLLARLCRPSFERLLKTYPQEIIRQFVAPAVGMLQRQANEARATHANKGTSTIALVPLSADVPLGDVARELAEALAELGPTLHLTSALVNQTLGRPWSSQTAPHDPANITLSRWLNEQESTYQYTLYEAEPAVSQWTERCLRQADHIVLVGRASSSPAPSAIERYLLDRHATQITPRRSLVLLHSPDTAQPTQTRRWLEVRQVQTHHHVRQGSRRELKRLARLLVGRGIAAVLSGGGAAGFGHIGALRALSETGVPIDLLGGTSMGGLVACLFATGWDIETIMAKVRVASRKRRDYTFPITALTTGGGMDKAMHQMFGDVQLEDLWTPCFCVSTDLVSGQPIVHTRGPVWKCVRTTMSIPAMLPPVISGNAMLVDGGLLNNFPTDVMRARPEAGTLIAVELCGTAGTLLGDTYRYESRLSGWGVLLSRLNPLRPAIQAPTIGQLMLRIATLNSSQQLQAARKLADYYIPLSGGQYSMLAFKFLEQITASGYQSARETIDGWSQDKRFQALQQSVV